MSTSRADALSGIRILVVDDDEDTRYVISSVLRHAGATVETAENAETALLALKDSAVDVIVSDIMMPRFDGLWLIREVRAHDSLRHIPAIAVTAVVAAAERRIILAAGFQAHVPKPIDFDDLHLVIRQVVAASRNRAGC